MVRRFEHKGAAPFGYFVLLAIVLNLAIAGGFFAAVYYVGKALIEVAQQ